MNTPNPGDLVSLSEAGRHLGVTWGTVQRWTLQGKLKRVVKRVGANTYPFVVWPATPPQAMRKGKKKEGQKP